MNLQRRFAAILLVTVAALASGCSDDSSSSSASGDSNGGSESDNAACVSAAQAIVDEATKAPAAPEFAAISGGVGPLAGKSAWFIGPTSAGIISEHADGFVAGMEAAGLEARVFNTKAQPALANQGVQEAVGAGADVIVIAATATTLVSNALAEAADAGIPVISMYSPAETPAAEEAIKYVLTLNGDQDGKWLGAYALVKTDCDLNLMFLGNKLFESLEAVREGMESYLDEACPWCKFTTEEYNATSYATTIGPQAVSLVSRDPGINVILSGQAGSGQIVAQALKASNHNDTAVFTTGGATDDLALVKSGVLAANIASSTPDFAGWTAADVALRLLSGEQPVENDKFYEVLVTTESLADSTGSLAFPDFEETFKAAWGVQ